MNRNVSLRVPRLALAIFPILLATFLARPCEAYQLKTNEHGKIVRWNTEEVTMCLGAELLERFGVDDARAAAEGAAEAWSGIAHVPRVRISSASTKQFNPHHLTNCIHLAETWTTGHDELALTYTASSDEGYVRSSDIVLNGSHSLGRVDPSRPDNRFDLQAILTHEMGHLLGLAENPYSEEATMNPEIGPGETFQRDLTEDDREGAQAAYEEVPVEYPGCTLNRNGRGGSTPWLAPFTVALLEVRRRAGARRSRRERTRRG